MFGHTAHMAPRESLIYALSNREILTEYLDPIHVMRNQLMNMIAKYWGNIQMQIPCGGLCYKCSKGTVVDCWLTNREHLDESEASMSKIDIRKDMTIEELEEAGIFNDRTSMTKFIIMHAKAAGMSSKDLMKLTHQSSEQLGKMVREYASNAPDIGDEDETEKVQKESSKKSKDKKRGPGRPPGAKNRKSKKSSKSASKDEESEDTKDNKIEKSDDAVRAMHKDCISRLDALTQDVQLIKDILDKKLDDIIAHGKKTWEAMEILNENTSSVSDMIEYTFKNIVGPEVFEVLAEADEDFPFGLGEEEEEEE